MDNSDERDYAEEEYNRRMMDEEGKTEYLDEVFGLPKSDEENESEIRAEKTITVKIPQVGTFCKHANDRCVILSTETFQEEDGQITTFAFILRVDDNGDDAGLNSGTVRWEHCSPE